MSNYAEQLRRFSVTRAQLGKSNKEMLNQAAERIEQLQLDIGVIEQELKVTSRNLRLADRKNEQFYRHRICSGR